MYYHSTSAFENPPIISGQEVQLDQRTGGKNKMMVFILIAGALLVAGILIGIALRSTNWTGFKNNEPERN